MLRRLLIIGNNVSSMLRFRGGLVRVMVAAGHEVHLLVPQGDGVLGDFDAECAALRDLGASVHCYPLRRASVSPLHDLVTFGHFLRAILAIRPDAVLAYMMKPVVYGMFAAALLRVPRRYALLDGLGFAFTDNGSARVPPSARITRLLLAGALRVAHRLLLLNTDDRNDLLRHKVLCSQMPTAVIAGTGLDLTYFDGPAADPGNATFLMISRLLRDKGVREFAEAARLVRQQRPNAKFVLVGDSDAAPGAIPLAEVAQWHWLHYAGKASDVRPFLSDCLAYVLPSYREGRPRTVMEAMAMRRACIVTDVPGCRDCIVDGQTGLVVPPRDAAAIARAIMAYIDAPELAITHANAARRVAETLYDDDVVNRSVLAALDIAAG